MDAQFDNLPGGTEWVRCAFQVNPFPYLSANGKVHPDLPDEAAYNKAIISALRDAEIDAIAITDHWSVDTGAQLRADAESAGLTVFPGFEATSKEGVHLLVIFDPGTTSSTINRYIGACGIAVDCHRSVPGELDASELLEISKTWGAVVIAPHVNTGGGLLDKITGESAVRVWKHPLLHAAAPGGVAPSQKATAILENKDPTYQRNNEIAVINAADVSRPEDVGKSGSSCWIKLSSRTANGLDLAFRTPRTRVSREDPHTVEHPRIVGIEWKGGFLDGTRIRFNSALNVLIGGRGTGKSTVIESIRYALNLKPLAARSASEHESMIRQVLGPGTQVTLQVETRTPTVAHYMIERVFGGNPVVRGQDGEILQSTPADIIRDIEIYGQRELADLARDGERLTELLGRYLPQPAASLASAESRAVLAKSRADVAGKLSEIESLELKSARLPAIEERLAQFDAAGVGERLDEQANSRREERILDDAKNLLGGTRTGALDHLLADLEPFEGDTAALPHVELLVEAREALDAYNTAVREAEQVVEDARNDAARKVSAVHERWVMASASTRTVLDKVLRELQPDGINGQEYLTLKSEREELKSYPARVESARKQLAELQGVRRQLLSDAETRQAGRLRELQAAAKKVRRLLPNTVQASVDAYADRSPLTELLKGLGGRLDTVRAAVESASTLSPAGFASVCREGSERIRAEYPAVTPRQAEDLAGAGESVFMQIEELEFPVTTDLELNVGSKKEPIWRSLDRLSTGQRATALLLLLLKRGSGPLIIDQPEDDLDNRFINQDIVPRLRDKGGRQIVFSSHNANIPVLGDADQLIVLRADDNGSEVTGSVADGGLGSIDHEELRIWVEELLEGGRDAFNMRRYMYGF